MMLSRVGIICFAASYAIVLAMEVSRLLFRSGIRGAIMLAWAGAGLFAHTVYLYYRAANTTGVPLSSWRDWCLVAAWALMAVYLYLLYFHPRTSIGLFLLPIVLGLDWHRGICGLSHALPPRTGLEGLGRDPRRFAGCRGGFDAGRIRRRSNVSRANTPLETETSRGARSAPA